MFNGLLPTQSDARLARLVRDGHERAFDVIVERYRRPLRRYCQRMLSEALAEDVVQQTFMHAWSALQDGMEIRDLRPWLYRVAHNAAINTLKRAGYHYEQLEDSFQGQESPDVQAERKAEMRSVLANVAALPLTQREALLRTAVDGESRSDVARHLGTTDGAVGQLLHRARTTLRAAASAITPLPLFAMGSRSSNGAGPATRIMELMGGGGGAGMAGLALKGGAVLATAGAMAGVPVAVHHFSAPASHTDPPALALVASVRHSGAAGAPLSAGLTGAGSSRAGSPFLSGIALEANPGPGGAAGSGLPSGLMGVPVSASGSTPGGAPDASPSASPTSDGSGASAGGDGGSRNSGDSRTKAVASSVSPVDSGGSVGTAGDGAAGNSSGADQSSGASSGSDQTVASDVSAGDSSSSSSGAGDSTSSGSGDAGSSGSTGADSSSGSSSGDSSSSTGASGADSSGTVSPDVAPADPSATPAGP
jgi:RNA polymerase sigma factor (sigma-70 family)